MCNNLISCFIGQRGLWYGLGDFQYYVSSAGVNLTYAEAKANCENNYTTIGQITTAETQDLINRIVRNGSGKIDRLTKLSQAIRITLKGMYRFIFVST